MRYILILLNLAIFVYATSISDFINLNKCDQIIDKKIYKICYSYKHKAALAVWYKVDGYLAFKKNIKKRPRFYSERTVPVRYRAKPSDYRHSGFDRGHLALDADFDYDIKVLRKTYSMANIVPQYPKVNRKAWAKAEKLERYVAHKLGYDYVINLVDFKGSYQTIGKHHIGVPSGFYKIIYNDEKGYKRCFYYKNVPNPDLTLKHHLVDCNKIKYIE